MSIQRYSVNQYPIQAILTWIQSGEIAILEIQRPFVWDATKVRNFIDSLYNGYYDFNLHSWGLEMLICSILEVNFCVAELDVFVILRGFEPLLPA